MLTSTLARGLVPMVLLLLAGCTSEQRALDVQGRLACTYAYLGGLGQLRHDAVAEDRGLLDAFQAARSSHNDVLKVWTTANATVGTGAKKSQGDADAALLRLLQVCRGLGWKATASSSPTPRAVP